MLGFNNVRYRFSATAGAWGKVVARVASTLEAMQERVGAPIIVLAKRAAPRVAYQVALSDLVPQQNVPTAFRGSLLCQRERPPLQVK